MLLLLEEAGTGAGGTEVWAAVLSLCERKERGTGKERGCVWLEPHGCRSLVPSLWLTDLTWIAGSWGSRDSFHDREVISQMEGIPEILGTVCVLRVGGEGVDRETERQTSREKTEKQRETDM